MVGGFHRCIPVPARQATKAELASVHTERLIDTVVDDFPTMTLRDLKHRAQA